MIPKYLLIHSCVYRHDNGTDRDGNKTFFETELTNVRFEAVLATAKDSAGESKDDKLTLYIDAVNTEPLIVPVESDRVIYEGHEYTIRQITPRFTYGGQGVHHYEAILV